MIARQLNPSLLRPFLPLVLVIATMSLSKAASFQQELFQILASRNTGDVEANIAVTGANPGWAAENGANGPVSGNFVDVIADYSFFRRNPNDASLIQAYADGPASRIGLPAAPLVSSDQSQMKIWESSDPGSNFNANPADFTSNTVTRVEYCTGSIDITGLSKGTLYFFYGSYRARPGFDLAMTSPLSPPVRFFNAGANDFSNNDEMYVTAISFEGAAGYDQINYRFESGDNTEGRGRFAGIVLTTPQLNDNDQDGLDDLWEDTFFGNGNGSIEPTDLSPSNGNGDADNDGLTDREEFSHNTNPLENDSDDDTLNDGHEVKTLGTNPLSSDSDGDTLTDDVETNTGVFIDSSDTGTSPISADSDADGLADHHETNTGTLVNLQDTGTSPVNPDSDNDQVNDWYEVVTITENIADGPWPNAPNDPAIKISIPFPLPDPDNDSGLTGSQAPPVKVYIMAGQSNMVGRGSINSNTPGSLKTLTQIENKFPYLIDENEEFTTRQDVQYRGLIKDTADAKLTARVAGNSFGPELGFGYLMGWHHDEPVLILKTSQGGRALGWDFLPPTSPQTTNSRGTRNHAGYGQSPSEWDVNTTPTPNDSYAGYQYDLCFLDEADWAPASTHPPVENVSDVLDNFATEYPDWAAQGFEIAGYLWWQGWNDSLNEHWSATYEKNMERFIQQLRGYFENRYPDNIQPNAPFVIATSGFKGYPNTVFTRQQLVAAQLAVSDATQYPAFAGNVMTMDTRNFWREPFESPANDESHYNHNAETYMLVGEALARGILSLQGVTSPGSTFPAWAATYPALGQNTGFTDDPDGDGLVNGIESFLGSNPTTMTSNPISLVRQSNSLAALQHPQGAVTSDVTLSYQWSPDLENYRDSGQSLNGSTVTLTPQTSNGLTTVSVNITGTELEKVFVNLKVTLNQ